MRILFGWDAVEFEGGFAIIDFGDNVIDDFHRDLFAFEFTNDFGDDVSVNKRRPQRGVTDNFFVV